jgi:hypothetical protein
MQRGTMRKENEMKRKCCRWQAKKKKKYIEEIYMRRGNVEDSFSFLR